MAGTLKVSNMICKVRPALCLWTEPTINLLYWTGSKYWILINLLFDNAKRVTLIICSSFYVYTVNVSFCRIAITGCMQKQAYNVTSLIWITNKLAVIFSSSKTYSTTSVGVSLKQMTLMNSVDDQFEQTRCQFEAIRTHYNYSSLVMFLFT